ncbi:MAG: metal ABC transporter permease [Nitrososphaeraceae archaeon]|nr:metal ABC transporter permease [Nitrososphaeraceae archaeon]
MSFSIMTDLFELLSFAYIQRSMITGISVAIISSLIGLFLVLKKQSLFGDAISHMAFGGIAIGTFLNIYPIWTAIIFSASSALAINKIRYYTKLNADSMVAVLLSLGLGIGVTLISISDGFSVDLFSFLFGSILLVSLDDMLLILGITVTVSIIIFSLYQKFIYIAFDEDQAKISGISVQKLDYLFTVLVAITVIVSMKLVGILMISSLIVIPNITALTFNQGFRTTMIISILLSIFSVFFGIILSYFFNLAPSGVIVLLSVGIFLSVISVKYFHKKIIS